MPADRKEKVTAKVAIVTRTKDREVTLRRTAACIMAQTFSDILWVVVNDGGMRNHVDNIVDMVRNAGREVLVVHNEKSHGRPASANIGINSSICPWLVLLDDDDTIEPQFVERCMEYLECTEFSCEGVAVWSDIIHERIYEDKIVTVARYSGYHPDEVSFFTLFYTNPFPPSSFIFSRKGWEAAGYFDERFHCSEDWHFNQRFLFAGRIGIIPEILAFLHHRVGDEYKDTAYANTVIHEFDEHKRYGQIWCDEFLRNDLQSGRLGLGQLNLLARTYFYSRRAYDGIKCFTGIDVLGKEDTESIRIVMRVILKILCILGKVLKRLKPFYLFFRRI
jgi:glycosyltransferase involved in cell wall biosynthesis